MLGITLTGRLLDLSSFNFLWTGVMAAVFKIDKNMQEMTRFIKIIRYKI